MSILRATNLLLQQFQQHHGEPAARGPSLVRGESVRNTAGGLQKRQNDLDPGTAAVRDE
jgi:hypothetical protein